MTRWHVEAFEKMQRMIVFSPSISLHGHGWLEWPAYCCGQFKIECWACSHEKPDFRLCFINFVVDFFL